MMDERTRIIFSRIGFSSYGLLTLIGIIFAINFDINPPFFIVISLASVPLFFLLSALTRRIWFGLFPVSLLILLGVFKDYGFPPEIIKPTIAIGVILVSIYNAKENKSLKKNRNSKH